VSLTIGAGGLADVTGVVDDVDAEGRSGPRASELEGGTTTDDDTAEAGAGRST
jgi:hypothetical protein